MNDQEQLELLSVLRELHNISGFRISIHDTKFREIEAYPKSISPFCQLIQCSDDGKCQCIKNDIQAFEYVRKKPEVYLYKCCFGLYEVVAPLYILGNIVGYLMMGQSIDGSPGSKKAIIQHASRYVSDTDSLLKAANEVHVCEKSKIMSSMKILDICAQYITLSNRFFLNKSDISDRIKQYLDENYAQNITIENICLHFFCSRTTAIKAFKNKYGIGIIEYLTLIRIQIAKRLLINTTKTVKEIAESCGYPDQNYFSKVFFKHCGIAPTTYRQSRDMDAV